MTILHLLSQREVTGAEAYAVSIAARQIAQGHTVLIVSDTLSLQSEATYVSLPISHRSYPFRVRNVIALCRLVRAHRVQLIHAHSRAGSWVANIVARFTRVAFVSTVHGRQHVHLSSRTFNIYGKAIIAVSEALHEHLVHDLGISAKQISVIPNGIDFTHCLQTEQLASPAGAACHRQTVAFIGRLTGMKGGVVRFLLREVVPQLLERTTADFAIVGAEKVPEDISAAIAAMNAKHAKPRIFLKGFQPTPEQMFSNADIVIGSGRVAAESLAFQKPTIALGETNYLGQVAIKTFDEAARTSFGDTGKLSSPDPKTIATDIIRMLQTKPDLEEARRLKSLVEQRFDLKRVSDAIEGVYRREYALALAPSSIPVLMYHSVVETPPVGSRHGIWVTAREFQAQLRSLKARGFAGITFKDYDRFLDGKQALPRKPIMLTFDDGYENNYSIAFPLLQQFGFSAVIYAVTDEQRRENYWDTDEPRQRLLSVEQMREMTTHGIEIGSHTVSHANLRSLSTERLYGEVARSKQWLEENLSEEIVSFAYPYGALNDAAKHAVQAAGYQFAVAADTGPFAFAEDAFEIRRTQVFPWTSRFGFWKKTLPLYQRYKARKSSLRHQ